MIHWWPQLSALVGSHLDKGAPFSRPDDRAVSLETPPQPSSNPLSSHSSFSLSLFLSCLFFMARASLCSYVQTCKRMFTCSNLQTRFRTLSGMLSAGVPDISARARDWMTCTQLPTIPFAPLARCLHYKLTQDNLLAYTVCIYNINRSTDYIIIPTYQCVYISR